MLLVDDKDLWPDVTVADEFAANLVVARVELKEALPILDPLKEPVLLMLRLVATPAPFRNCDRAEEASIESEFDNESNPGLPVGSCSTSEEPPYSPEKAYTVLGVMEEKGSVCVACTVDVMTPALSVSLFTVVWIRCAWSKEPRVPG